MTMIMDVIPVALRQTRILNVDGYEFKVWYRFSPDEDAYVITPSTINHWCVTLLNGGDFHYEDALVVGILDVETACNIILPYLHIVIERMRLETTNDRR